MALTFDDGPDPRWTPRLLDLLEAHSAKATFFVTGNKVTAHPELARRIAEEGHEIGAHTFTHADISNVPRWRLDRELDLTQAAIGTPPAGGSGCSVRPTSGGRRAGRRRAPRRSTGR